MANWIFTTKISEEEFETILEKRKWPLKKTANNRNLLGVKDNVVFYRAIPYGSKFVATTIIDSKPSKNPDGDSILIFGKITHLKNPVFIKEHLDELELIRSTKNWQVYLMGGTIRISNEDFKTIVSLGK